MQLFTGVNISAYICKSLPLHQHTWSRQFLHLYVGSRNISCNLVLYLHLQPRLHVYTYLSTKDRMVIRS